MTGQASLPAGPKTPCLPPQLWDYQHALPATHLRGCWGLSAGPCACVESALPTELSPQP